MNLLGHLLSCHVCIITIIIIIIVSPFPSSLNESSTYHMCKFVYCFLSFFHFLYHPNFCIKQSVLLHSMHGGISSPLSPCLFSFHLFISHCLHDLAQLLLPPHVVLTTGQIQGCDNLRACSICPFFDP